MLAEPSTIVGVQSAGRTPDEDVADSIAAPGANRRRSSSVWKGLNIKRRLSKVNTKISSTLLGDSSARRGTPLTETQGGDLSSVNVVNVEPDMVEQEAVAVFKTRQQSVSAPHSRKESSSGAEGLELPELPLEEAIAADETLCDPFQMCVMSGGSSSADRDTIFEPPPAEASCSHIASHSVVHAAAVAVAASFIEETTTTTTSAVDPSNPVTQTPEPAPSQPLSIHHVMSPDDRPSAVSSAGAQEPPVTMSGTATTSSTGAIPKDVRFVRSSRPTELCLFDNSQQTVGGARPVPMQRTKRNRMQSVPNIKLNRLEANKLIDIRQREPCATYATTTTAAMGSGSGVAAQPQPPAAVSSSFVDMFKRFSKYKHTQIHAKRFCPRPTHRRESTTRMDRDTAAKNENHVGFRTTDPTLPKCTNFLGVILCILFCVCVIYSLFLFRIWFIYKISHIYQGWLWHFGYPCAILYTVVVVVAYEYDQNILGDQMANRHKNCFVVVSLTLCVCVCVSL